MKILLGYSYYKNPVDVSFQIKQWIDRLNAAGFDVEPYPLTINPPAAPVYWQEMDKRWKLGDKELLGSYEKLAIKAQEYDVFLNASGINVHPDFISQLPTFNVFGCFDDPEASEILSKPVAPAYDLCLVANIAEVETYLTWGCKFAKFWPAGFLADQYDPTLTEEKIMTAPRTVDISLLCEKKYNLNRISRLNKYHQAFPQGKYYGEGWNTGFLKEEDKIPLYLNTKIGPNFHNSTGPINYRVYTLPANGVMQICDNKSHLGEIFELDKEVVGFDTVEEAIELTKYYLHHEEERKAIALAGWKRAIKDYNEEAVFGLVVKYVNEIIHTKEPKSNQSLAFLKKQRSKTWPSRLKYVIENKFS